MMTKDLEIKRRSLRQPVAALAWQLPKSWLSRGPLSIWLCGIVKRTVS